MPESLQRRIAALREDRVHGASWLAREAADIVRAQAVWTAAPSGIAYAALLRQAAREVAEARPSMAAVANAVAAIVAAASPRRGEDAEAVRRRVIARAEEIITGWPAAVEQIATIAEPLLQGVVLTLSYSSTVVAALLRARPRRVIVAESRPGFEGRRVAEELAANYLEVTLVSDAALGHLVSGANAVAVGADTVFSDGGVVNKAGTYPLALVARDGDVPCYVLAETFKLAPRSWWGSRIGIEEKDPAELWPSPPPGVTVRNVYFDYTPGRLLSGYVTEMGLLNRRGLARYAARMERYVDALYGAGG